MTAHRATFRWPPSVEDPCPAEPGPLAARLEALAAERSACGAELVAAASRELLSWMRGRGPAWSPEQAERELELGLASFARAHRWRGAVAHWLEALRECPQRPAGAREALLAELASWTGEPLAPRAALARQAAADLGRAEIVVLLGPSDLGCLALLEAGRRGLDPLAVLGLGGPARAGLAPAREFARAGVRVRLVPDLGLWSELAQADRLWIGTEAIGAGSFLAALGTRSLVAEGRRLELRVEGLATAHELAPGGRAEPPAPDAEDEWALWCEAPPGVELVATPFELVPLELVESWWTEVGREGAREFVLRALRPSGRGAAQAAPRPSWNPTPAAGLGRCRPTSSTGH